MLVVGVVTLLAAPRASRADSVPLGLEILPTVPLYLEQSDHTEQKCVMVNNRSLFTTIRHCPLDAYQCDCSSDDGSSSSSFDLQSFAIVLLVG
jgi:hypothetical protein